MNRFFAGIRKRPSALISFIILIVLYMTMLFAEFIAPYDPVNTFPNHSFHPPNFTLFSEKYGFGPQIQKQVLLNPRTWEYARLKGEYLRVNFFVRGPEYKFLGFIPMNIHLFGIDVPYQEGGQTWEKGGINYPVFLMGSDNLGRDLFSRIVHGSRISLTIGFVGTFISMVLSILLGGLAGYYGGLIDWIVMRIAEFIILIPGLYLILFLRSVLMGGDIDSGQAFMLITVILSFISWPGSARTIRGIVHSIKREDFIAEAQLSGIPSVVIIFKQIIPQISSLLIVNITLSVPGFILGETALSYLGLGIVDPSVSWGSLLNRNISSLSNLQYYPWLLYPGLYLLLTTVSFSFLGDLLRDILDPYHRDKNF